MTMREYHPDPILNWLASQFSEGLVIQNEKAKAAFDEIVRLRKVANERKHITQPSDWWAAFEKQAKAEGLTLAAWLGEAAKKQLPTKMAKKLSERPPANRPKKNV